MGGLAGKETESPVWFERVSLKNSIYAMIPVSRSMKHRGLSLPMNDGLFEFGLLVGHTHSRKPFLSFGYPSFDVFGHIQGYASYDDDGIPRHRSELVATKEGG